MEEQNSNSDESYSPRSKHLWKMETRPIRNHLSLFLGLAEGIYTQTHMQVLFNCCVG